MKRFLFLFALLTAIVLAPAQSYAQTLNFTAQATAGTAGTLVPRLTWTTAPVATSCAASGAWAGTKGPQGVQTLTAISESQTYHLTCTWPGTTGEARLSWTPPTRNVPEGNETEGTPYTNPQGFIINYATTQAGMTVPQTRSVLIPTATSATVTNLAASTYFMCVRAINTANHQSACSSPLIQKVVTATSGVTVSRSAGLSIIRPMPPTNVQ